MLIHRPCSHISHDSLPSCRVSITIILLRVSKIRRLADCLGESTGWWRLTNHWTMKSSLPRGASVRWQTQRIAWLRESVNGGGQAGIRESRRRDGTVAPLVGRATQNWRLSRQIAAAGRFPAHRPSLHSQAFAGFELPSQLRSRRLDLPLACRSPPSRPRFRGSLCVASMGNRARELLVLRSLKLRCLAWNGPREPDGLSGSGRAKDVFRLGMIMGSSSVEESSSSDESQRALCNGLTVDLRRALAGAPGSSSCSSDVSTRALPFASMVNLTEDRGWEPPPSGMDVRLESRLWFLEGEILPVGRPTLLWETERFVPIPELPYP